MAFQAQVASPNSTVSPGGFEFGVQGFIWPDPIPRSITFFLDGTALVADQFGRAIKGSVHDGREVWFATTPPPGEQDTPRPPTEAKFATHAQVVAAMVSEGVDWRKLTRAGWPQLSYDELQKLPALPPTPEGELRKIKDPALRKDALRIRREADEAARAEGKAAAADEE